MSNYSEAIKRLISYRTRLGKTQQQMGQLLNLAQEQYSNVENEVTILSESNLNLLRESGCDINFLLTGKSSQRNAWNFETELCNIEDGDAKDFLLKCIAEYLVYVAESRKGAYRQDNQSERERAVALLAALTEDWKTFSMIRYVYNSLEISQTDMAVKLGVGIKKCRKMEYGKVFPDAEIIVKLYELSGCMPVLFTDIDNRKELIIGTVWDLLEKNEREKAVQYIKAIKGFVI